jgi:cytochrome c oxidase subunit 1
MHSMGIVGMPRRYSQFTELVNGKYEHIYQFLTSTDPLVLFVTVAAIGTALAQFIFLFNFIWSLFRGERAGANPWDATTLEWVTPSPPPHDNFGGVAPVVYRGAYEFAVPGAPEDYVLQTNPDETGPNTLPAAAQATTAAAVQGAGNGHDGHR